MVAVDVLTETIIERPRDEVFAFVANPDNAPLWYVNIKRSEWRSAPPLAIGSRIAFVAHFLGRDLSYTYEITEHVPGERIVMRTAEGPFPMETSYVLQDAARGTRVQLRNRGNPTGFGRLLAPFLAFAMRRANRKDLALLKKLLEAK